jgi:hypothetical protein
MRKITADERVLCLACGEGEDGAVVSLEDRPDLGDCEECGKKMEKRITRSLFIEGREWFDKVNGNSYFSARLWVDGGQVAILTFQYGYGDQYLYEAQKKLLELGYLPQENKNQGLWSIAQEMGFDFYSSKSNHKKADMFKKYPNYEEKAVA